MFKPGFIVKKLRLRGMFTTNHKLFTILDSLKAYLLKVNARINWKKEKNTEKNTLLQGSGQFF